ncbi:hypothetical protein [Neobacillus niacini]|uniref:hypothetical protein n=2 Tax=Neobacillus niacini TaxID=86668 RepID=UPI0014722E75|nr:hypothetical protein [Neobacillus niacini]
MRLWRVCAARMEKQLNDYSILTNHQNRQVILNYYSEDEMLYQRDGFHFQTIQITKTALVFTKKDGTNYSIEKQHYPLAYIKTDFQNYYTLKNNQGWLDVYFP